jgi:hypothetical protein
LSKTSCWFDFQECFFVWIVFFLLAIVYEYSMDAGCVCAILATGVAEIRLTQVQSQTPSQQKNLGVAAHTCLPSYHGKHKIGESWSKLT